MAQRYGTPSPASAATEAFSAEPSASGIMGTVAMFFLPYLPYPHSIATTSLLPYDNLSPHGAAGTALSCRLFFSTFVAIAENNTTD